MVRTPVPPASPELAGRLIEADPEAETRVSCVAPPQAGMDAVAGARGSKAFMGTSSVSGSPSRVHECGLSSRVSENCNSQEHPSNSSPAISDRLFCPTLSVSFARAATGLDPGRCGTAASEASPQDSRFPARAYDSDAIIPATAKQRLRWSQAGRLRMIYCAGYGQRSGPYPARCTGQQ